MSDLIIASMIGVGGSVLVAIVSLLSQSKTTKAVVDAEKKSILDQIKLTDKSKAREKWIDRLIDLTSDLLVDSDPQSEKGVNYGRATNLILQIQLILDRRIPEELALNNSLNKLGNSMHSYYQIRYNDIDDKQNETQDLLLAQGEVIENTRAILNKFRQC